MPRLRRPLTLLLAGLLLLGVGVVPALGQDRQPDPAPTVDVADLPVGTDGLVRAIVAFEDGELPDGILQRLTELGVVRGLELASIGAVALTAPAAVVDQVSGLPGVAAVEPQRRLQLDLYASKAQIDAEGVEEPEAYTADVDGTPTEAERPGVTGEGVTVAVLDTGIFAPHPDFGDRVPLGLHFAFSEIQDTGGISYEQWDAYAESTGTIALQDEIGHGTHVASTVGGSGAMSADADGPDLAGVAPGVEFVSMKVADAPFGIVDDIDWEEAALAAFDYIIRHPELGIRIAQNSWGLLPTEPNCAGLDCGEPTDFDAMAEMIGAVEDAGVSVVFSAGNDGPEPDTIGGYHRADQAILVGAACKAQDTSRCLDDPDQRVADFSSRGAADGSGPQVDVIAPGDNIMAAVSPSVLLPLTECPDTQQPGYYCISGTSMASPHVSGVVALMYEANPDLTVDQVEECLYSTAEDDPGVPDIDEGHGMVETRAALQCAHAMTLSPGGGPVRGPAGPGVGDEHRDDAASGRGDGGAGDRSARVAAAAVGSLPATGGGGMAVLGLLAVATAGLRRRG